MNDYTQPEALRLAEQLADWIEITDFYENSDPFINDKMDQVKIELRRLHEVNQELVDACTELLRNKRGDGDWMILSIDCQTIEDLLAKATREKE